VQQLRVTKILGTKAPSPVPTLARSNLEPVQGHSVTVGWAFGPLPKCSSSTQSPKHSPFDKPTGGCSIVLSELRRVVRHDSWLFMHWQKGNCALTGRQCRPPVTSSKVTHRHTHTHTHTHTSQHVRTESDTFVQRSDSGVRKVLSCVCVRTRVTSV
jgi:hypothetical protein